ncbi:hypothetical protein NDA13_000775 [Ustilago tritici]|nr:hypothetical protein NDA13_000775 [Ustilago tritici]
MSRSQALTIVALQLRSASMMVPGSTGPILRTLRRPRLLRLTTDVDCGSRLASTSRATLGINKSYSRASPASSSKANARSNGSDATSQDPPTAHYHKPRTLPLQHPGRGVSNEFIDQAKRDMQLRNMKYDEVDLKWLREARHTLYSLHEKEMKLQQEQKQLKNDMHKHLRLRNKASKKEKRKTDVAAGSEEVKSADEPASESSETSTDASAKDEQDQHIKELRKRAKKIKQELENMSKQEEEIRAKSLKIRISWPNYCHPDVPVGPEGNAVLVSVKDPLNLLPTEFDVMKESWNQSAIQVKDFPNGPEADPKRDHLLVASLAEDSEVDLISGTLATGRSWPFLLGSISMLEHALSQYAMSIAVRNGFLAVSPPDVVRAEMADRCGFRPRDEKAQQTYFLENTKSKSSDQDQDLSNDLCLAATAEIPLAALLAARIFEEPKQGEKSPSSRSGRGFLIERSELPIKLVALGHAFRAEAGARGAETRGLYRVHQFSKIEMFVATNGEVDESNAMLEELRGIQEEVIGGLGLPYRVLDMPTEELGASAYRKYDIEVWMPGRGSWGEVSSASNCINYQALRLGIKMKRTVSPSSISTAPTVGNDPRYPTVHTLNATAAAIPRLIVAILENHGIENEKLVLPDTLKPFWLAGEKDPNVTWLHTGKLNVGSQSCWQRALAQVRSIAKKNGTNASTMVASFLILHELTALVPLVLLFYIFGALGVGASVLDWLLGDAEQQSSQDPTSLGARFQAWARLKEERFERYCRRKGYLGFEKQDAETIAAADDLGKSSHLAGSFANMVAAYILVKTLIPVRIGASVALAGPFSRRVLEPLKTLARRTVSLRKRPNVAS